MQHALVTPWGHQEKYVFLLMPSAETPYPQVRIHVTMEKGTMVRVNQPRRAALGWLVGGAGTDQAG
jgi:hypothetical protein